jgi:plasmid stability protein
MAELVIGWIEDAVVERLERCAKKYGSSLEELVRDILRDAAKLSRPSGGLGSEIAALFRGSGLDFKIPELRGRLGRPLSTNDRPRYERAVGAHSLGRAGPTLEGTI